MKHKVATTIDEQITLLKSRGMIIENEVKAKEHLLDVGYYRLGFYWFPFEKSFPTLTNRNHKLKEGTKFECAIELYYFDFDLRNILLKYISRIEINFRTSLIYIVSNEYKDKPTWYVDKNIVKPSFVKSREYTDYIAKAHEEIHFNNRNNVRYAPAWKVIEFFNFGTLLTLFANLTNEQLRQKIALKYGFKSSKVFLNHLNTIRRIRNYCAHNKVLFDINLPQAIATSKMQNDKNSLWGSIIVIHDILKIVSHNRAKDLLKQLSEIIKGIQEKSVIETIERCSKISLAKIAQKQRETYIK